MKGFYLLLFLILMPISTEACETEVPMETVEILRTTHRVRVGMTKGQVFRVLGRPESITVDKNPYYGETEKWGYGENNPYSTRVVLLFKNGIYMGTTF